MKYRQTFREALKDVDIKDKTEEKPVDDKDATIKKLEDELHMMKVKYQELKIDRSAAIPDKETGEVPLRTGVAAALLDKKGPSPKIKKDNKKLKMSLGKSKIKVDPDVPIGQISGGIQTGTGNLH
jgi:hypothetical protein